MEDIISAADGRLLVTGHMIEQSGFYDEVFVMEITEEGLISRTIKFASPYAYNAYQIVELSAGGFAISG